MTTQLGINTKCLHYLQRPIFQLKAEWSTNIELRVEKFQIFSSTSVFPASRGLSRRGKMRGSSHFASSWETSASRETSVQITEQAWVNEQGSLIVITLIRYNVTDLLSDQKRPDLISQKLVKLGSNLTGFVSKEFITWYEKSHLSLTLGTTGIIRLLAQSGLMRLRHS